MSITGIRSVTRSLSSCQNRGRPPPMGQSDAPALRSRTKKSDLPRRQQERPQIVMVIATAPLMTWRVPRDHNQREWARIATGYRMEPSDIKVTCLTGYGWPAALRAPNLVNCWLSWALAAGARNGAQGFGMSPAHLRIGRLDSSFISTNRTGPV